MAGPLENESFVMCVNRCDVEVVENVLLDTVLHSASQRNQITLQPGFLAKVREVHASKKTVQLRIYDFYQQNFAFENNLFACAAANLQTIAPPLWPFLIGIPEPLSRMTLFRNQDLGAYLLGLRPDDLVLVATDSVIAEYPGHSSLPPPPKPSSYPLYLTCIIRYIGLVSEIGPGFYLGVEITDDLGEAKPLQPHYSDFIGGIVHSGPGTSLLVRAHSVVLPSYASTRRRAHPAPPAPKDYISKLLLNTVERAKNEFTTRASTLRRSKRNRAEEQRLKRASWNSGVDSASLPAIDTMDNNRGMRGANDDASDRSTSTKSSQLTNASSNSSSTAGGGAGGKTTSGAKKKTPAPPPKPTTTILSLGDRDVVIIDDNDIKESVQNESEVIVVENPPKDVTTASNSGDVDLMEILGNNWPALAGDTAHGLNAAERRPSNGQVMKPNLGESTTRNKSMNIISHLKHSNNRGTGLSRHSSSAAGHQYQQESAAGSANSSFESSHSGSQASDRRKKASLDGPLYDNLANASAELSLQPSRVPDEDFEPIALTEVPNSKLGLGSMVEVQLRDTQSLYGVIQWIGLKQPTNVNSCLVGVELDEEPVDEMIPANIHLSDGMYAGVRIFKCPANRAIFVPPSKITKDRRFQDQQPSTSKGTKQVDNFKMFGQKDCPVVPGFVPPLKILAPSDLEKVCGKFKGIQGHHNSCYLDATLFSMFTFTSVFDSLLFRPADAKDIASYEEVQTVLRDEIVNPLRKNLFVRADRVMKLRKLLDRLSSVTGLLTEEKDPEEFLNSLLAQILRVQPFLQLSSGQDAYFYQLFVEKDERLSFPSVQQLFEQSFLQSDIKLKEVPSCLIIQMPRFGKDYKLYPRILPSLVLDVTHIIEDSPRPCSVCSKLALFECKDCFGTMDLVDAFESTAFCAECLEKTHSVAAGRHKHNPRPVSVPEDFRRMSSNNCIKVPHLFMELFAVVCIETSHYVSFVKAGSGQDAPWCFFDSMADRKGEMNGYNIPEMLSVELAQWLSEEGAQELNESFASDKMLPEHARRLFCDAYMCMYQSSDIMMYR